MVVVSVKHELRGWRKNSGMLLNNFWLHMLKTTFPKFHACYHFVNSDFRPCCYGVARCIILKN